MRKLLLIIPLAAVLIGAAATRDSAATPPGEPYLVFDITGFIGPNCSAPVFTVTNRGDSEQPFGWTLTLKVKKAGISLSFPNEQALAPGETVESQLGTGLTESGHYGVEIGPDDVAGRSKPAHAMLALPNTC